MSYAFALTAPGLVSSSSKSSSIGAVNGWCTATYLFSSSSHSSIGNSVTHKKAKSFCFVNSNRFESSTLNAPKESNTTLSLSAQIKIKSPAFPSIVSTISCNFSGEKNFAI